MVWGFIHGHRFRVRIMVRVRVKATAIWNGFELYECLIDCLCVHVFFFP